MKKTISLLVLSLMFAFVDRAHAQDSANSVRGAYLYSCRYVFQVETENSGLDVLGYGQRYAWAHHVTDSWRSYPSTVRTPPKSLQIRCSPSFLMYDSPLRLERGYTVPSPQIELPYWFAPLLQRQSRCSENVFVFGSDGCGNPSPYFGPPPTMPRRDSGGLGIQGRLTLY